MANNTVTRSTVNEAQYSAPEFSKSGFNLSHRSYMSFGLGRLQVSGMQWCMPGDKISGNNKGNFTMKNIVTPMVAPIDVAEYNFFLPLRALDKTFERAMVPTKLNAMSASWSAPTTSTSAIVKALMEAYFFQDTDSHYTRNMFSYAYSEFMAGNISTLADLVSALNNDSNWNFYSVDTGGSPVPLTLSMLLYDNYFVEYGSGILNRYPASGLVLQALSSLSLISTPGSLGSMSSSLYLFDAANEIVNNIIVKLGTSDNPLSSSMSLSDFFYIYFDSLLTPFVGRYSYYADFHYNYVRPSDLKRLSTAGITNPVTFDQFYSLFDSTPVNEYPLRMMYVVWYERFRDVNLEPVSTTLPDWHEFGSNSFLDPSNGGNLFYLVYRFRNWYDDVFVSAQIDDLSRHVYAPIINSDNGSAAWHNESYNNNDTNVATKQDVGEHPKPSIYVLHYIDQQSGLSKSVECPVPTNVNDLLASVDQEFDAVYGLDLNTLRQSQMIERYLKRNYLFGDEYQDRMLAHYNSRVSDMRINKPELIGQSMSKSNMSQEIANMTNEQTNAGDRTATGTLIVGGDDYTTFCEEFGILLHVISFMPQAAYDGINPQLLLGKQIDFPLPEFAANNEEFGRKMEIASSGLSNLGNVGDDLPSMYMFGRYPAYHAWRSRVDTVGGDFLNELQDCTFRRFWGLDSDGTTPKLNYAFLHCRPNLGMFRNSNFYDMQIYGDVVHECFVERVLPTPVEVI